MQSPGEVQLQKNVQRITRTQKQQQLTVFQALEKEGFKPHYQEAKEEKDHPSKRNSMKKGMF